MIKASVLLLTYNQEEFIAEALNSILSQDYENLEIIVSDDNSHDHTWQIIQEITSNHPKANQIILNKNINNLGVVGNYYKAFSLSSGELIFTAAGDDVSLPNRCSKSIEFWLTHNKPSLVAADGYDLAINGTILGIKETDNLEKWNLESWHNKRPFFFGASHMMTKELIDINILNPRLPYEDQCFVLRAILKKSILRLPKPLIKHRRGGISQKSSPKTKKELLLVAALDSVTELNQMLDDAICLGKKTEFLKIIDFKLQEYKYAVEVLRSNSKIKSIKIFYLTTNVPFFKKIRYLNYSLFPLIMESIHIYKKIFKHAKR